MENPQAQVGCGEEESIGLLFRQLVQVSPARKWKKHTSRTLQRDLWSRRASFVDPRVAPHLFCWLNVLQQSRFDVLVIQCGVVVVRRGGGISPFESSFLNNTKRRGSAGCKTYRHFMWVQCRQENKSVCAQIVDSPNFCHSSQDEMGGGVVGGIKNNTVNFNRKHTYGSRYAPQSIRLCSAAFIIPRFQRRNPVRAK